jgi:hypothetical protein
MQRALDSAEAQLEAADDERAQSDLEKIRSLRGVYDRAERLVDVLTGSSIDRLAGLVDRLRRSGQ